MASTETKKICSNYISFSKAGVIKMRDNLDSPVLDSWNELLYTTAAGGIGLLVIPGLQYVGFSAGIMVGILTILPTNKELLSDKLGDIVDKLNNNEHVIIEFKEELTYNTISDFTHNKISKRELKDIFSWASTGTTHISNQKLAVYLGYEN